MKNIPILTPHFDEGELARLAACLQSGWVAQGPLVREFEARVAACEGVRHGVAATSCTTALHLALAALGLAPGDDVLVPSFTFVATANAAEYLGARPVFIDVDPDTFCLDPEKLKGVIEEKYRPESGRLVSRDGGRPLWGLIAVHLFGLCADMRRVNAIAGEYGLTVLEDSACALGSSIDGVREGAFGNAACLSFHARKTITCGEGGMVLTDSDALAETLRRLRNHGASASALSRHQGRSFLMADYDMIGYNYRMTDLQAAVGLAQMDKLDWILERKAALARRYDEKLRSFPGVVTPKVPAGFVHTWQSYVLRLAGRDAVRGGEERDEVMARLEDAGVATRQGTHAVHMLTYYARKYGWQPEDLPGARLCDRLSLALPLYAGLGEDDQDYVIESLAQSLGE